MPDKITMPKLSDTMTEGRFISWKKSVGDHVDRGDVIAEVETDKANMEIESFGSGTLLEQRVNPGDTVPVGGVIGVIGEPDKKSEEAPEAVEVPPVKEAEKEVASESAIVKASPMVRRLAREKGIDLEKVNGSGPGGRITQEDMDRAGGKPPLTPQPLNRIRSAVARMVSESWRQIPHFTVTVAVEADEAEKIHREMKNAGFEVSFNDLIIKATATTIAGYPLVNASFTQAGIERHDDINICIAVNLDDGVIMPVIKGCRELSVKEIAKLSRKLIDEARRGVISERDLSGGTFSVSNMGMLGVEEFSAVIYPPQGAILAVAAVLDDVVVKEGKVCASRVMRMTLSADHRLIDGAYAARFMAELKRVLENPLIMLA